MKLCTIGESILRCKPHIPCAPVLNGTVLCRLWAHVSNAREVYPVAATMVAASTGDTIAEDKWLTYWSCFSLVTLVMTVVERAAGAARPIHCLLGNDALPYASDVQRGRRDLPQRPRTARGAARGATPQGRQDASEDYDQATAGVETWRSGGGDRRGLPGRGQDAKVGDSDIID